MEPADRTRLGRLALSSGLSLSYVEQGEVSEPALVMLHGPTDSWRSYEPILPHLPQSLHAIAVSQRGHGDSDKPDGPFDVRSLAADAGDTLEALSLERAVLAGHSASCLVARRVAIDRPDLVSGLVLEASPVSLSNNAALTHLVASTISHLEDPVDHDFVRSFVTGTSSDALPADLVDALIAETLKVPARVWRAVFDDLLTYDDIAELADVDIPVLLVWGDADGLVSRGAQGCLLELLPAADLVVYEGVGHTPRWEQPSRFAGDVADFVNTLRT